MGKFLTSAPPRDQARVAPDQVRVLMLLGTARTHEVTHQTAEVAAAADLRDHDRTAHCSSDTLIRSVTFLR